MAITSTIGHVTWPTAAKTKSVASAGNETSEDYTYNANTFQAIFMVKSVHSGTAVSGDEIYVYAQTECDPDDDATDENANQETLLGCVSHYPDGAAIGTVIAEFQRTVTPGRTVKIYAENDGAAAVTISVEVQETKSA